MRRGTTLEDPGWKNLSALVEAGFLEVVDESESLLASESQDAPGSGAAPFPVGPWPQVPKAERQYPCPHCGQKFPTLHGWKVHQTRVHPFEDTPVPVEVR